MYELTSEDIDLVKERAKIASSRSKLPWQELQSMGWLGLLQAAMSFDPSIGQFGNYARPRIDGAIKDALRTEHGRVDSQGHRRMKRHPLFIDFDSIDRAWSSHRDERSHLEEEEFAEWLLGHLPPRHQLAFRMRFWDGLSEKEIAAYMNVCEGRVSQILRRGKLRLLELITRQQFARPEPVDEPLLAL